MKFPNWFKIIWWLLLTGGLSFFMWRRLADLVGGKATSFDIVAFVIWVGLLLAPVFAEVELWGLKLKQEIASVKEHVDRQVQSLRADIRNSVDIRSQFSPNITLMAPPPDAQLPKIEEQLRLTLERELESYGLERQPPLEVSPTVPGDAVLFFEVRYSNRNKRSSSVYSLPRFTLPSFPNQRSASDHFPTVVRQNTLAAK